MSFSIPPGMTLEQMLKVMGKAEPEPDVTPSPEPEPESQACPAPAPKLPRKR